MIALPNEVLGLVVNYLDRRSVCALMQTCRAMQPLYSLRQWEITSREVVRIPLHLCEHVSTLRLDDSAEASEVFTLLHARAQLFTRLETIHLNRRWARCVDSNTFLQKVPVRSLYLYEYGQELPTVWPTTLRVLVIRDMFTTRVQGNLDSLQTFDCGNSRMEIISGIKPSLVELYVRSTRLRSVPDYCTNLRRLNLSGTRVTSIPDLPKLTHLDVSRTAVSKLPETLVELVHLNISQTKIRRLSPNYTKLRVLKAQECPLLEVPSTYADITVLSVKATTSLTSLPPLAKLERLDIRKTGLDFISAGCKALKRIRMSKTEHIPPGFRPVQRSKRSPRTHRS